MPERRYGPDEVDEIFGLATSGSASDSPTPRGSEGLTLTELQSIGHEVGLEPGDVARAAAAFEAGQIAPQRRTTLGLPVEVGRTIPLPRTLTDAEWERLVAELRMTFRARGKVSAQGSLREWSNGNLHAMLEPAERGYRLRLVTRKGDASGMTTIGIVGLAGGAVALLAAVMAGGGGEAILGPALLTTGGAGAMIANALRLPRWGREREAQMDHITRCVVAMLQPELPPAIIPPED